MLRGRNHQQTFSAQRGRLRCLALSVVLAMMPMTMAWAEETPSEATEPAPTYLLKGGLAVTAPSPEPETIAVVGSEADEPERVMDPIELRNLNNPDEYEPYDVTLADLIRLIQNRNLDVAIAKAGINQAKGYLTQAYGYWLPNMRFGGTVEQVKGTQLFQPSFLNPSGAFQLNRRTLNPRMAMDYQISLGGRQYYQLRTAQFQLGRAQENVNEMSQQALLDSLTQYFNLLRNTAAVEVARQSLREASAQRMLNEKRLKAGFGTQLDVMQSLALEEQRKSEVLEAENLTEVSGLTLVSLLDLPITMRLHPEFSELKPLQLIEDHLNLEDLYQIAMNNRPDLKQMQYLIDEARARYGIARSDLFPTLGFSSYYQGLEVKSIDQFDNPVRRKFRGTFELQANINLAALQGMGLDVIGDMQVNKARIQEAILNLEKQKNDVQRTLATAYQDSKLGLAQMRVAYQKMLAAREEYRIAAARLKAGIGINLELIQAQKDLNDARLSYQDASLLYNRSQLRLLFETGQLTVQKLEYILSHPYPEVAVAP